MLVGSCLHCSVCRGEYSSKADWNLHLFTDSHQTESKNLCLEEWDQNLKQRSLLVFSSFPLGQGGGATKLVHHLSQRFNFVTDLVLWMERPYLALVQLESRQKAEQVLMAMQNPAQVQLEIQLKWAANLGDLEWKAMFAPFPLPVPNSAPNKTSSESNDGVGAIKRALESDPVGDPPENGSSPKKVKHSAIPLPFPPPAPPPPPSSSQVSSLVDQFRTACQSIQIPEQACSQVNQIVEALTSQFHLKDPTVQLCLFRNWFLQLHNPSGSNNELLVYLTNDNALQKTNSQVALEASPLSWIKDSAVQQVFSMPTFSKVFQVGESHPEEDTGLVPDNEIGWKLTHRPTNFSFRLIASKRFLAEVQMCKLVKYLCTFDPRCYPLLNLVYYWANLNNVQFGRSDLNVKTHRSCPEPITLQWLVIFFLCQRGIIPTPRQVQARPHQVLEEKLTEIDIGFETDTKWAESWSSTKDRNDNQLVRSVLTLFKDFLFFYGKQLSKGKWVLNTRDGNLVKTHKFLKCTFSKDKWAEKMSDDELATLKYVQGKEKSAPCLQRNGVGKGTKFKLNLNRWKLYILHPFVLVWKLSVSEGIGSEVLPKMRTTGEKLTNFLQAKRTVTLKDVLTV